MFLHGTQTKAGRRRSIGVSFEESCKKSKRLEKQLVEYLPLFSAVYNNQSAPNGSELALALAAEVEKRAKANEKLSQALDSRAKNWNGKGTNPYDQIQAAIKETGTVGGAILSLCQGSVELGPAKSPVLTLLLQSASEEDDLEALVEVLNHVELDGIWSYARKAIQIIDFSFSGPQTKNVPE